MTLAKLEPVGTVSQILTSNGTGSAPSYQARVFSATAQASTSGTEIDFTGIPSWVKRVTVMFNGVSTNGTSNLLVQLGDSGGIENTGYVGQVARGDNTRSAFSAGFIIANSVSAANDMNSIITVVNVSGNIWVESSTAGDNQNVFNGSGNKTLSDTLTQVRITTVNGTDTFDAGSINILYE